MRTGRERGGPSPTFGDTSDTACTFSKPGVDCSCSRIAEQTILLTPRALTYAPGECTIPSPLQKAGSGRASMNSRTASARYGVALVSVGAALATRALLIPFVRAEHYPFTILFVRIETISTSDNVRVMVEDTGPGIPEGLDVFALFETTKAAGTGLGLAICKEIVLAHGGGITFGPRAPTGTVFYVDLPLSRPQLSRDPRGLG
jgi:K+-sensing histidine kinase KdpD